MAETRVAKKKRKVGTTGVQLGEDTARAMIVQGAVQVFAKDGVRLTSVEDILTAGKVSRRTFYRFYSGKEDVAAGLYRMGTEGLLEACKLAVREHRDPLAQVSLCIDAHLRNARGLGRLMFVLGGEAQRHESPLHARRMEVHDALTTLLHDAHPAPRPDPWIYRAVVLALEGIVRLTLEQGDEGRAMTDEGIGRAKRVMMRVAAATLVGHGDGVPVVPVA